MPDNVLWWQRGIVYQIDPRSFMDSNDDGGTADRPEIYDIIAMMRRVLDDYDDRVLISEIYLPVDRLVTYSEPFDS